MLFNSFGYLLFFPVVITTYYMLPYRFRWIFLLLASYFFYMCWKAEYIILITSATLVSYLAGIQIERLATRRMRFAVLITAIIFNLGILFFFKYVNLLSTTLNETFHIFGLSWHSPVLDILLPVGISFYTFQIISYLIDVYRGEITAERHIGIFALFISFFPQLVAGPIERARKLLPQLLKNHDFDYERVCSGLKLLLWGMFKKIVIADRLGLYVDSVYNNSSNHSGQTLIVATIFFSFQMYCDFSGYTDIAIGSARVMGIKLMDNFRRPYFSKSISELWRRWHISLSSWIHDYLYLPIVFKKRKWGIFGTLYALMISFVLCGLWHGPKWNYVFFGFLQGCFICYDILKRRYSRKKPSRFRMVIGVFTTFTIWSFSMIFFRSTTLGESFYIIKKIYSFSGPFNFIDYYTFAYSVSLICFLIVAEARQEYFPDRFSLFQNRQIVVRYASYITILICILTIGVFDGGQFIYFQF